MYRKGLSDLYHFLNDPSSWGYSANQETITRNQRVLKPGKSNLYQVNKKASTKYPALPFLTNHGETTIIFFYTEILQQV